MTLWSRFRSWLRTIVGRSRMESDMDTELRFHIETFAEELVRGGLSRQEAMRRARMEFGGIERAKEECREARGVTFLESLAQDIRFALRMLRKSPGFTALAVLTLALGIGANTTIFSIVDAALLHPLPFKDPGRLVWLTESLPNTPDNNASWLDVQDWKQQNNVFEGIAGYSDFSLALTGSGNPQILLTEFVSKGYFDLLGVPPLLGRTFKPEEHLPGGPFVVVLSDSFWIEHFAGDPGAIGKTLKLSDTACTIVGVMPAGFGSVTHTVLWAPFEGAVPQHFLTQRAYSWSMYAVARLKPHVTFEQARTNILGISERLEQEYPKTTGGLAVMLPLARRLLGDIRPALLMLSAAVFFLLLIACANIASLLLVKAVGRQKEIALRLALGAGKWRLFRQLIVESMVLSVAGAAFGLQLASGGTKLLAALLPAVPFSNIISVNRSALLFTLGLTLLAGLLFGLAPALMGLRMNLQSTLKSGAHQVQGSHHRAHRALVITEVGLAAMLLIGAGLMLRSMMELFRVAPGFDTHQLLTEAVVLAHIDTPPPQQCSATVDQAVASIQQLPGVDSAAAVFPVPFADQVTFTFLAIKDRPPQPGESRIAHFAFASTDYFRTLHIPPIEGRMFTAADTVNSLPVAVIDQELAKRYWPGQDPIGRQIRLAVQDFSDLSQNYPAQTIVGVVGTIRAGGLDADLGGYVYSPASQQGNCSSMTFVVRSRVPPLSLAHSVESAIHEVTPDSPVFRVQTMDQMVQASQATRRLSLRLLGAFSLGALLLAALGLYGVISYVVSQSTNEIGVRVALGAQRAQIMKLVLGQGMRLALWGIAVGIAAALALTRLMASLLFGVTATDPSTFAGVGILLAAVTLLACYIPARRAMRVDPIVALRYE
jgi:putative ABC transport system permease protein